MPIIIEREVETPPPKQKSQLDILDEAARKNGLRCLRILDGYNGKEFHAPQMGEKNWIIRRWIVGYRTVALVSRDGLALAMYTLNKKMFSLVVETAKEFERLYGKKMTIIK